jgi:glutamate-ammonia-ligase adenylyltransferase
MRTREDYWREWTEFSHGVASEEEALDRLRDFVQKNKASLLEEDIRGVHTLPETFAALTELADAALRVSIDLEFKSIQGATLKPRGDFSVVAMGKFGGRELNYQSDLDIIYLYENPEDQEFYTKLGAKIIRSLSLFTKKGFAYRIDTALRPSGNSGTLVSSLSSFLDYHRTLGRVWERQALIKARPVVVVSGGQTAFTGVFSQKLQEVFAEITYQDIDATEVTSQIDQLRDRMENEIAHEKPGRYNLKTGRGGLVDIEFLVQFLQLKHGKNHPNLRNPNTLKALDALSSENILSPPLAGRLQESYLFLRELGTRLRQELQQPTDELYEGSEITKTIEKKFFPGRSLMADYQKVREEVRRIYILHLRETAKGQSSPL